MIFSIKKFSVVPQFMEANTLSNIFPLHKIFLFLLYNKQSKLTSIDDGAAVAATAGAVVKRLRL